MSTTELASSCLRYLESKRGFVLTPPSTRSSRPPKKRFNFQRDGTAEAATVLALRQSGKTWQEICGLTGHCWETAHRLMEKAQSEMAQNNSTPAAQNGA